MSVGKVYALKFKHLGSVALNGVKHLALVASSCIELVRRQSQHRLLLDRLTPPLLQLPELPLGLVLAMDGYASRVQVVDELLGDGLFFTLRATILVTLLSAERALTPCLEILTVFDEAFVIARARSS